MFSKIRQQVKMLLIILALIVSVSPEIIAAELSGVVFNDVNRNLVMDEWESGIPGVPVSNGRDVILTDSQGKYTLTVDEETEIFISKPSDYDVPVNENNLPQFFYIHRPTGSPDLKFGGVKPTGKLPETINFPLFRSENTKEFKAIILSDPQAYNNKQLDFVRDEIVSEIAGIKASFAIVLGDIVGDDLSLYNRHNRIMSAMGIPVWNVPGNHDRDYDAPENKYQFETYNATYGPEYYSFNYGKVHFMVLEDIEDRGDTGYWGALGEKQLEWARNDLAHLPEDFLIVLNMHIPMDRPDRDEEDAHRMHDRFELYKYLESYDNILALAGHTHTTWHLFFDENRGWNGKNPIHQLIAATASGYWWSGIKDERGIPVTDQRDGTPNGYHIFTFNGNQYSECYKGAYIDSNDQMNICLPGGSIKRLHLATTEITVNIFDGSEKSIVECKVDDLGWIKMKQKAMIDPFIAISYARDYEDATPVISHHIWTAPMPEDLDPGTHTITVKTIDMFGQIYKESKVFEVIVR